MLFKSSNIFLIFLFALVNLKSSMAGKNNRLGLCISAVLLNVHNCYYYSC
jgi:hypothetical protein